MTDVFDGLIGPLLAVEGGYVNDPRDAGGETNWGITAATARAAGYTGPMKTMSRDQAAAVYRRLYWTAPRLDLIATKSARTAALLFDIGVNMGVESAGRYLQRVLNVLNRQGADYPDLQVDGAIGPATAAALAALIAKRGQPGENVLLKAIVCLRGARYVELAEGRPANEAFEFGWLANRVALPV